MNSHLQMLFNISKCQIDNVAKQLSILCIKETMLSTFHRIPFLTLSHIEHLSHCSLPDISDQDQLEEEFDITNLNVLKHCIRSSLTDMLMSLWVAKLLYPDLEWKLQIANILLKHQNIDKELLTLALTSIDPLESYYWCSSFAAGRISLISMRDPESILELQLIGQSNISSKLQDQTEELILDILYNMQGYSS